MTAKRYGMAHHTIKYWQDQAADLRRMRGHYAITALAASLLHALTPTDLLSADYRARRIGHAVISLAAIAGPDYVRFVLQHGRFPLVRR